MFAHVVLVSIFYTFCTQKLIKTISLFLTEKLELKIVVMQTQKGYNLLNSQRLLSQTVLIV